MGKLGGEPELEQAFWSCQAVGWGVRRELRSSGGTSLLIQPSLGPILFLIFLQFPQVFGHPLSDDDLMLPPKSTKLFISLS